MQINVTNEHYMGLWLVGLDTRCCGQVKMFLNSEKCRRFAELFISATLNSEFYSNSTPETFTVLFNYIFYRHIIKSKAHPLQAMQAQRGLGELRLLDFLTSALHCGRLSASRTGRLYPQGHPWYSFSRGAESTPGPWFSRKEICHWKIQWHDRESIPGPSQRLNHYATPGPLYRHILSFISVHNLHLTHITSTEFYQNYRNVTRACEDISELHYDFKTWKDEIIIWLFLYIKYIQQ
jgi:hypothetical protein